MTERKRGLGRGLSALMSDVDLPGETPLVNEARPDARLPIEAIHPNPSQPRRDFDPERLAELAASIRARGILQPIIVRPHPQNPGAWQIVAGERRWRAAQLAKLHEVPAIIRDFSDEDLLEVAILENVQREDLNPLEEAQGYQQLLDTFSYTHEQLAETIGKSRSYIANAVRLLTLPPEVQELLRSGALSAGHARALITAPDPVALARRVVEGGLSVRETEKLARQAKTGGETARTRTAPRPKHEKDADTVALEGELSAAMGMRVEIRHEPGGEAGQVVITYRRLDQLDEICRILSQSH